MYVDSCSVTLRVLDVFSCHVFTYMLLEYVSSTTFLANCGFCILYVSVGRN